MSEVPDISQGLSSLCEPVGGSVVSAVVPENGEPYGNLHMDAEDSLPVPSFLMTCHSTGIDNVSFIAPSSLTSRLQAFEQREIQPNEREVDVEFFSHLLIFYMMKEDWAKARQCRLRAEASVTNVHLNTLMLICHHLEDGDTGAAVRLIKNSHFDNPVRDLIMEVHKRIILSVLRKVEHTYINIEAKKLAEMFDAEANNELQKKSASLKHHKYTSNPAELYMRVFMGTVFVKLRPSFHVLYFVRSISCHFKLQILARVGWVLEDGYVIPKMTSQLMRKIKKLNASPYGPVVEASTKETCGMMKDAVDINKLIQYATFLEIST
uniref:PCI domain-containing protein n=1 Tax=Setaria digitata TaxID=48799 RepID=A0A915PQ38_9BILA